MTSTPTTTRAAAFAAALALLAMLGVASGFWSVAHRHLDHASATALGHEYAQPSAAAYSHNAPAPSTDIPLPPADDDCRLCDLIAGAHTLTLAPAPLAAPAVEPTAAVRLNAWAHPPRQVDLTAWSARPPPHVG